MYHDGMQIRVSPVQKMNESRVGLNIKESQDFYRDVEANLRILFGSSVSHNELRSVAQIVCLKTGLTLDPDTKFDYGVLIKWFSDNWDCIGMTLAAIHLVDDQNMVISSTRKIIHCNIRSRDSSMYS